MKNKLFLIIISCLLGMTAHADENFDSTKNIFDDGLMLEIKNEAAELNIYSKEDYLKESANPQSRLNSFKKLIQNLIASTEIPSTSEIFIGDSGDGNFSFYNDKSISKVQTPALQYADILSNPIIPQTIFEYLSWLEYSNNPNQCELIDRSWRLLGYTQMLKWENLVGIDANKNTLLFYRFYHSITRGQYDHSYPCVKTILENAGKIKNELRLMVQKTPDVYYSLFHIMRKYAQNNYGLAFMNGGGSVDTYFAPYLKEDGQVKWVHLENVTNKVNGKYAVSANFMVPRISRQEIAADADFSDRNFVSKLTSLNTAKITEEYRKRTAVWMGK